jgi:hypothetical protein
MKSFILLLSLSLVFASCSTAYKSGQTPDDVYFSPERPRAEYVRVDDNEDRYYRGESNRSNNDYYNYEEERYLRMKVRNRQRWSYLDNDFYSYNPYAYNNFGYYYNSPWNSYSYWDHYYNPYARQVIIYNSKTPVVNRPRTINLRTFDGVNNSSSNQRVYGTKPGNSTNNRTYSTPQRTGGELRNIFNNSNNNSSNTPSSNRTSTNSSSSSSSSGSSSSGGGSAPARRF